jgi:hypothetical protein
LSQEFLYGDCGFFQFLAAGFDAFGACLDPLPVFQFHPLQVRVKPVLGGLHGVGPFNGAGIAFAANLAFAHRIIIDISLKEHLQMIA